MNTKMNLLVIASIITVLGIMIIPSTAVAETNQNSISVKPINEKSKFKRQPRLYSVYQRTTHYLGEQ